MNRAGSVRRVRRQRHTTMIGFIISWDVDSRDTSACARVRRFVFGYSTPKNGKLYRYPGIVELAGVRYLGQSVLFVTEARLSSLREFLRSNGVEHAVMRGSLGPILPT